MAAKKSTTNEAATPSKSAKAPAAEAKKASTSKKATGGKELIDAEVSADTAPKKAAPSKVVSSAKPKKEAAEKASAKPVAEAPVEAEDVKKAVVPAAAPAAKKVAPVKPRSSVVDFPAPPAPVKPPFVPPKAAPSPAGEPVAAGSNGSHSPAFIQKQKQRLLDLRDNLYDAMSGMTRDTIRNAPEGSEASGSGMHQGDAGSDAYDRDFALSVLAKEQDALYEIEQALRRIQTGTYGICEISSRKIPQARLEVIPFARLTVEEQAQWEKEYGNRRFRPSNEVGFSGGNTSDDEDSDTVSLDEDDD